MRRLLPAALPAALLFLLASPRDVSANPPGTAFFGCGGYCFKLFPNLHQHGPLFNYGPYYGYYPFAPYGPWDAYLRYDPNFYNTGRAGHCHGCNGFHHASWLQGGWFRGHNWLSGHKCGSCGGHGAAAGGCSACGGGSAAAGGCTSCGGVSTAKPVEHCGNPVSRYSGFGTPAQSAVFYSATPTLDPTVAVTPTAGYSRR